MNEQSTSPKQLKSADSVSENKTFLPVSASGLDIIPSATRKRVHASEDKPRVIDGFESEEKVYGLNHCPRQLMTGLCAMLNASAEEGLMAEAIVEFQSAQPSGGVGFEGTGFGVTEASVETSTQQPRFK